MHKNEYQGGYYFELFDPSVKDPFINCKLVGSQSIQKIYEKEVKGSVYQLDGIPTTTKICLPKDSRQGLSLIQRYLVLQLEIRQSQDFSLEIGISDLSQTKRNLFFSTSHKDLNIQPLSARIPLKIINRKQWTNVVFDIASIVSDIWKNQTFKTIETISVCASCKLRKIFTLKNPPINEYTLSLDNSIVRVEFPGGTNYKVQQINLNEIKSFEGIIDASTSSQIDTQLDSSQKLKKPIPQIIAFGSKVPSATIIRKTASAKQSSINSELSRTQTITNSESKIIDNDDIPKPLSAKSVKIDEKKLPHPPPTSRPVQTTSRNVRLSVKSLKTKFIENMNETVKANEANNRVENSHKINENNINDSISEIIQTLKLNDTKNSDEKQEQQNEIYTFSSQPKAVENRQSKDYDFRKYVSDTPVKLTCESKESIKQIEQVSLMDSFEAKMLLDMKAEMMDQNSSQLTIKSKPLPLIKKEKVYSPLAFTQKQDCDSNPTSEKYNFEVINNSIDSIDTSISNTNNNKYKKDNYQDEMNIVSIIAENSVNLVREEDGFYLKAKQNTTTEEKQDSQATDLISDETSEDEEIDLLFDSELNCYYDPKTGIYYEAM